MQPDNSPVKTDLVLLGGGHSHLFVLRHFAMNPLAGVRLTLVSRDLHTPYSGMLPGFIAGHYSYDETHIDLLPLARYAGARIIHAEVNGLDSDRRQLKFADRPALDYDLLSINIGSRPSTPNGFETDGLQFAVKPVDRFIASWDQLERRLCDREDEFQLAIIGGGAGGVELALSLDYRARKLNRGRLKLTVVTDRDHLLPGHNSRVRQMFRQILERRSIKVVYNCPITGFANGSLQAEAAEAIASDAAIWVTHASPASWLQQSGLQLDSAGFIALNPCLQSLSHDDVFAAGDIAAVSDYPRPKSGVFAVRQGIPLARNLRRRLRRQKLHPFRPQRQFLSLISTGERFAVASRGPWALRGKICWWLKDRIDRNFMRRFQDLPQMQSLSDETQDLSPMRCGGCGSKVGSEVLERVLAQINHEYGIDRDSGLQHADDAALIAVPPGMELVQSIDHFRSFIDDPYLFGRIAAIHALGDLHAMGVEAHSAMVLANVVFASESKQAQDLYQLMSGVVETLAHHGTLLAGGHSGEASQMSCGLSVNGFARREDLMLKAGMQPGELLLLTKPLGSGVLFAAEMRGKARGAWIDSALAYMLQSSRDAAKCLRHFGASACTDVTGFGLAGHLFEMARASACAADIFVDRLPFYDGAVELARAGIESSLQPQNIRIRHAIDDRQGLAVEDGYPLIFDPQTAGGLLASIDPEQARPCLQRLHELGYAEARVVGRVVEAAEPERRLNLVRS